LIIYLFVVLIKYRTQKWTC